MVSFVETVTSFIPGLSTPRKSHVFDAIMSEAEEEMVIFEDSTPRKMSSTRTEIATSGDEVFTKKKKKTASKDTELFEDGVEVSLKKKTKTPPPKTTSLEKQRTPDSPEEKKRTTKTPEKMRKTPPPKTNKSPKTNSIEKEEKKMSKTIPFRKRRRRAVRSHLHLVVSPGLRNNQIV